MSAVKNLKWKRSLSTLRFSYEELEYIEEVSSEAALEFERNNKLNSNAKTIFFMIKILINNYQINSSFI